jgi:protein-S-isoprenylcysteine O-methyltransferase Ste14
MPSGDTSWALVALALYVVWIAAAFGVRTLITRRRLGDSGFRGLSGMPGSAAWWAGMLFAVALLVGFLSPIAGLVGFDSWAADSGAMRSAGVAVALVGVALTVTAQSAMGDSWRVGVDESEHTTLRTSGPFRVVRNPIFSAMVVVAAGLTFVVANFIGLTGLFSLAVAVQLQVRLVEEPYLLTTHHGDYRDYASRVGRFVPGVGRLV